jgi:hypothetical protein
MKKRRVFRTSVCRHTTCNGLVQMLLCGKPNWFKVVITVGGGQLVMIVVAKCKQPAEEEMHNGFVVGPHHHETLALLECFLF